MWVEWPLISFTLLLQTAVGAYLFTWLLKRWATVDAGPDGVQGLACAGFIAVGPIVILGLLLSLFHLGSPARAWRALANLSSSWLSYEILFSILFLVTWAVSLYLYRNDRASASWRTVWAGITAVLGMLAVYSSARIYFLPTQPAWHTVATFFQFFATAFVLGSLIVGAIMVVGHWRARSSPRVPEEGVARALRLAIGVAMIALGVEAISFGLGLLEMATGPEAARGVFAVLTGQLTLWFWLRVVLGLLIVFALALTLARSLLREQRVTSAVVSLVFATLGSAAVGEVFGRALFYASAISDHLPAGF